jgi:uncharacterized repeat protein (TIGR03803 family)
MQRHSLHIVFLLFSLAMFCASTAIGAPAQTFTTLVNFDGTNGSEPLYVIQGSDGNFYGTTYVGGGIVFKMTPQGTLTTLYNNVTSRLVQGRDGDFYGTSSGGGGLGTVFKMTNQGKVTTLHTFDFTDGIGGGSTSGMVQSTDGNFYGTTSSGGFNDAGSVFKITPDGTFTSLFSFQGPTFLEPSTLVQGTDGSFYGTAEFGGSSYECGDFGCGTVFKITPSGTLTTLYNFCSQPNCTDGVGPKDGLVKATDGNFYGTTYSTLYGLGTVFKITPGGTLTTIYRFSGTDGAKPAGLVQATDGNFYGTAATGGNDTCEYGCGTVFEITPGGTLTTLHSFGGTDGFGPEAGLVQATDGKFYGTTFQGGANHNCNGGCGTVFSLSVGLGPFVATNPTSANLGAPVIILGTNLTGATSVTFNGTPAAFNIVSASEITTTVPDGATTGPVQVNTPSGTLTSNVNFRVITPLQLVPVTPCRLVDTRNANGEFGGPPLQGNSARSFTIPDNQDCNVPSTAAAYSLNVTVVPHGSLAYLTMWPTGQNQPVISTLNSYDGRTKANAAIVPAGAGGAVSVYVTDTADVVLDIDGYFAPVSGSTLAFYPLPPCRVADTRSAKGDLGGPFLTGGAPRDFPVREASSCNIPNTAQAYSLNFTAVPHVPLGFLTVWPTGQSQPGVSTLNSYTGQLVANAAIVPAGTDGKVSTFASNDTDLVIDINGYFAPAGQNGLSLYAAVPCRAQDTRSVGDGQPFSGELTVDVLNSGCTPGTAQAYVFNATVVPPGPLGFLTLWPDGSDQPGVSTLNAADGAVTSNMAIVPAGRQGKVDAYATNLTQLILDISSYFAP